MAAAARRRRCRSRAAAAACTALPLVVVLLLLATAGPHCGAAQAVANDEKSSPAANSTAKRAAGAVAATTSSRTPPRLPPPAVTSSQAAAAAWHDTTVWVTGSAPTAGARGGKLVPPPADGAPEYAPDQLAQAPSMDGIGQAARIAGQNAGAILGAEATAGNSNNNNNNNNGNGNNNGTSGNDETIIYSVTRDGPDSATMMPRANGVSGLSFSDSRFGAGGAAYVVPGSRVGKLYARFNGRWRVCTASVINKALLLTAAHCVSTFGAAAGGFPDKVNGELQVQFVPGMDGADGKPYGAWAVTGIMVPAPYAYGTDTCEPSARGVICNNNIALLQTAQLNGRHIGEVVGWNGYGWNGYGFAEPSPYFGVSAPSFALVTQLGYFTSFDRGERLQISNSPAYTRFVRAGGSGATCANIVKGTAMTGGSSGSPWVLNLGADAALSDGASYLYQNARNIVVGVSSWGFVAGSVGQQGASYLGQNQEFPHASYGSPSRGAGNIGRLLYDACDNPALLPQWGLKSKGACV